MKSLFVCIIICIYQKKAVILSAIRSTVVERLNVKDINGKQCVFCAWRRRWVRLTPEEWVRQHFLHRLVSDYGYPSGRIGVEVSIALGDAKKRCDAVVYDEQLRPQVLIECKAEHVAITQRTLDQAITYNRKLNVPYLFLHNGPETVVVQIDCQNADAERQKTADAERLIMRQEAQRSDSIAVGQHSGRSAKRSDSKAVLTPQFLTYIPQWSQL